MSRIGPRPETLEKYQRVRAAHENGCETVKDMVGLLGLSRSTIFRALQHYGIRLERQRRQGPKRSVAPYSPEPYKLPGSISPLWAAEFRGFFFGEGWVGLANKSSHYAPRMAINLRLDDRPMLEDIYAHVGGGICVVTKNRNSHNRHGHPQARWALSGWPKCRAVIEAVFMAAEMPAKKRRDILLFYEVISLRYDMPYWPREQDYVVLQDYYIKLMKVKRFGC